MQLIRHALPATLSVMLLACGSVYAIHDGTVLLRLDGANYMLYNQEYPNLSENAFSTVYGNPLDSFPFQHIALYGFGPSLHDTLGQRPKLAAVGRLSAELGDPLLNRHTGSGKENRDHSTIFGSALRLPADRGYLFSGYRYLDIYTDKFDEKWGAFQQQTGRSMDYQAEGLAHEFIGGYAVYKEGMRAFGSISRYGYWGCTPIYFSPLYKSGAKTSHSVDVRRGERGYFGTVSFDHHRDYYDHWTETTFSDFGLRAGLRQPLKDRIGGEVLVDINTAQGPSTRFQASVVDSFSELLNWSASGGIFNDLHPFMRLGMTLAPLEILSLSSQAAWDFVPAQRSYVFYDVQRPVAYQPLAHEVLTLHNRLTYQDTLFFPVTAAVWADFCDKPLWEKLDFDGDWALISQDTVGNAARWHVGGLLSYLVSLRKFTFEFWGNASVTPKSFVQRISLPKNLGLDFGYGNARSDSLYFGGRAEMRDRVTMRFRNDEIGRIEELVAPAQVNLSIILKIPFIFPWLSDHVASCFWLEAGPAHIPTAFLKEPKLENQRVPEHPGGNMIGPRVAVRFDGQIR